MTKRIRPLKNKKGFTLIEAIAVTTIMAILAVLIGSLIASSSNYYNHTKDTVSAKDISAIIEKMVLSETANASEIFLQKKQDGKSDLPGSSVAVYLEGTENIAYYVNMSNPPFGGAYYKSITTSANGEALYQDTSTQGGVNASFVPYIATEPSNAFYGDYRVKLHFKPIKNGNGLWLSILVFADVYKKDGSTLVYKSTGKLIEPKRMVGSDKDKVFCYSGDYKNLDKTSGGDYKNEYINLLNKKKSDTDNTPLVNYDELVFLHFR